MKDPGELKTALEGLGTGFEFVRELGRGATAIVYLLRDHELGRDLAVKVIRSSFIHDDEAVARLQREARLVAQLQHPNIVRVYSTIHLPDGSLALLMEHVPGRNLKEVLRQEGQFTPSRATSVLREITSALAYAHRRKIVHRDVKPENIYLDDEVGAARLADFGVARPWDRDTRLTLPGESLGTPAYMSPEQIDGHDVDGRSDVYSIGLVGYEMLSGEHPWERDNLFTIIFKQKNEELPSLAALRRDAPPVLVQTIEKALSKDPGDRWESAEALLDALRSAPRAGQAAPVERRPAPEEQAPPVRPAAPGPPPSVPPAPPQVRPMPEEVAPESVGAVVAAAVDSVDYLEEPAPSGRDRSRWGVLAIAAVVIAGGVYGWSAWSARAEADVTALGSEALSPTPGEAASGPPEAGASTVAGDRELFLRVVSGDLQTGQVATSLDNPLTVRAVGADSTWLPGTTVRFRITAGGGSLLTDVVRTDAEGIARAVLTLPDLAGRITVEARVEDEEGEAVHTVGFGALAVAGPVARIMALQGDGQLGAPGDALPRALAVRVVDSIGNPVPAAEVRFEVRDGDGRAAPALVVTDSLGLAGTRWNLGDSTGTQRIVTLVTGAEIDSVVFTATVEAAALPDSVAALPPPPPLSVASRRHTVGGSQVCVLDGQGRPFCRGAGLGGGSAGRFTAIAAGVSHACGLTGGGEASCWGANESGQLGDGSRVARNAATPVQTEIRFSSIAGGLSHTCALDSEGAPHCWGRNLAGQLGDGTRSDHPTPRPAQVALRLRGLVAGWNHSCALDSSGRTYCWGLNADGQLGDGTRLDRLAPTRVPGAPRFTELAAGAAHSCGLYDGEVHCWGDNAFGQLGDGSTGDSSRPVRVAGLPTAAVRVATGAVHTCALLAGGAVYCWGQNVNGQLGDQSTQNRMSPVLVSGGLTFRTLEAGGGMTCGVVDGGREYCWGLNQSGQLGDGTRSNRSAPTPVGD